MKSRNRWAVGWIIMAVPVFLGLWFYRELPDPMATHFNLNGIPDGFSSKWMGAVGMPLSMLAVYGLMIWMTKADPKRKNHGNVMALMRIVFPVFMVVVQGLALAYNLGHAVNINGWMTVAMGLLFLYIGNYLPKLKRNYTMGIKTPWTLEDDEVWDKTHRLGGYLWMLGGVGMIGIGLLGSGGKLWYALVALAIITVVPVIYAYRLYRQKYGGNESL